MRVLLVEDDQQLSALLRTGLEEQEIRIDRAANFADGRLRAALGEFDVIVLDVLLPGGSGVDLCRHVRERGDRTPILMLTARGTVDDRVQGLEAGADDYLVKPFAFEELVARLRALARRPHERIGAEYRLADLVVDLRGRSVERAGRPIQLTRQEWDLLEFFVRHEGAVVDRAAISAYVWDDNHDPFTNLLEVLIWRLRKKIDDGFEPKLVHTVRGAGYRFGT